MRLNGFTELAITKLDVLSGLEKVKVAKNYSVNGKEIKYFPYSNKGLEQAKPVYVEFEGFKVSGKEKKYSELDAKARKYLEFIEKELGGQIKLVSVGAGREETILK